MNRTHVIQLVTNKTQETFFKKACGCKRVAYNWALAKYTELYKLGKKPKIFDLKKEFNSLKENLFPWIYDSPKDANQRPFINLQDAFSRFFKKQGKYPKFKKKGIKDSFYLSNDHFKISGLYIYIPKLGKVKLTERLRFSGKIVSGTIKRKADRWFVCVAVDINDVPINVENQNIVGVDLGIKTLATLSNGLSFKSSNPLRSKLIKLKRLQRCLSRKVKGSKNSDKQRMRLARLHYQISCIRKEILDQLTYYLCNNFKYIVIEDLNVSGMIKNHKLALSISDCGFYEFRRQLEYKSKLYGNQIIVADRFFPSSKTCSCCGWKKESLSLSDRTFVCESCGQVIDRDLNASINLKNYGLKQLGKVIPEVTLADKKALVNSNINETVLDEARILV